MNNHRLEIGPAKTRIPGFETLDVVPGPLVDHVADCRRMPFTPGTFALVYASHVIEHIPWYETADLLQEWARVLAPGGALEVWTVNAYLVAKALVEYEEHDPLTTPDHAVNPVRFDGWHRFNHERDGYKWVAGRLFAYAKRNTAGDPNWHRALFTPRSLQAAFTRAGFVNVRLMDRSEVRAKDHGRINLGVRGERPC